MANRQAKSLTISKDGNTYTIRGLTAEELIHLNNAITEHQDISGKLDVALKGAANGLAELDSTGKVPSTQLPSYVDDVLEYASRSAFPATGEAGKIYVAKDTDKVYRWSGTTYVVISETLALGETSSTAYRGDRGKSAYDHASDADKIAAAQAEGMYKVAVTSEGHIKSVSSITKSDIVNLGIPGGHQDISGKADKVGNAVSGNFASLDSHGNLVDSGHKHSDYLTEHQDISGKLNATLKGAANGLAELDSNGKVPSSQLPAYVDDVLTYNTYADFPAIGEDGKIYVAKDTNRTYRWGGSSYVAIASDLALGETSGSAYRGDRGKIAYDHATDSGRLTSAQTLGLYKLSATAEGHLGSVQAVVKSDLTALGLLDANQGSGNAGKFMKVMADGSVEPGVFDPNAAVFTDVEFTIPVNAWTEESSVYTATVQVSQIVTNSCIWLFWGDSYYQYARNGVYHEKTTGAVIFSTATVPSNAISGMIRVCSAIPIDVASQLVVQGKIDATEKGAAGGVATLDVNGKVPDTQLPDLFSVVNGELNITYYVEAD